jgi:hypothetical protein
MPKTYMLIDLQNQQPAPAHVASWIGDVGEAWIFFGEHELGLLPHYFEIGPQVSIVPIARPGNNSLDFHLVMYLGYLIARCKQPARFVVVASDRDYDAAIEHACSQGFQVERISPLPAAPTTTSERTIGVETSAPADTALTTRARRSEKKTAIAAYAGILSDLRSNPPGNLKALRNRIGSRLGDESSPSIDEIIDHLRTMDVVDIQGDTLRYLI